MRLSRDAQQHSGALFYVEIERSSASGANGIVQAVRNTPTAWTRRTTAPHAAMASDGEFTLYHHNMIMIIALGHKG